ncbi:MAG: hypothetical protein ABH832_03745 [bacterium]
MHRNTPTARSMPDAEVPDPNVVAMEHGANAPEIQIKPSTLSEKDPHRPLLVDFTKINKEEVTNEAHFDKILAQTQYKAGLDQTKLEQEMAVGKSLEADFSKEIKKSHEQEINPALAKQALERPEKQFTSADEDTWFKEGDVMSAKVAKDAEARAEEARLHARALRQEIANLNSKIQGEESKLADAVNALKSFGIFNRSTQKKELITLKKAAQLEISSLKKRNFEAVEELELIEGQQGGVSKPKTFGAFVRKLKFALGFAGALSGASVGAEGAMQAEGQRDKIIQAQKNKNQATVVQLPPKDAIPTGPEESMADQVEIEAQELPATVEAEEEGKKPLAKTDEQAEPDISPDEKIMASMDLLASESTKKLDESYFKDGWFTKKVSEKFNGDKEKAMKKAIEIYKAYEALDRNDRGATSGAIKERQERLDDEALYSYGSDIWNAFGESIPGKS